MKKSNINKLKLIIFSGVFLVGIIGVIGITNAQNALPSTGDSIETAVEIQPGSYQGGEIPDKEAVFYFIQCKAGQMLKVNGVFTPASETHGTLVSLTLYNENKEKITGGDWDKGYSPEISWLPNSEQDSYKYYVRIGNDSIWGIKSYTLDLALTDRYDANSQTDAGDTFGGAMNIAAGEYEAYLSGKVGTDQKDFYKVDVEKGETLTVKVTPPEEAAMEIVFYDSNRSELKDIEASNPGAIITNSLTITNKGNIFIAVLCDKYCSKNITNYNLSIGLTGKTVEPKPSEVSLEEPIEQPSGTIEQQPGTVNQINEEDKGEEGTEATTKGFSGMTLTNWFLTTLVGLIILVGIMIIIFLLIRKKKNV